MNSLTKTIDRIYYQFVAHPWVKDLEYEKVELFAKAPLSLVLICDEINSAGKIDSVSFYELTKQAKEAISKTFKEGNAPYLFYQNLINMIEETYEKVTRNE